MTTALLLIDIQQGLFDEAPIYRGEEMVKNAASLLERARKAGIPVVHVQHDGGKGDSLEKGTPGFETHPAVKPRAGEHRIVKSHCSSFSNTGLDEKLKSLGVTDLVVAGLQTDFCIDTACRVAHSLGYKVTLAEDAHSTFDSALLPAEKIIAHTSNIIKDRFARMVPASAINFGA
jgi:nicotinamidase-related amidase